MKSACFAGNLAAFVLALASFTVFASEQAATVTHLAGGLLATPGDGKPRILAQGSALHVGDLVTAGKDTVARLRFADGAELSLRPNTQVRIEAFRFVAAKPAEDSLSYALLKGGLRAVTGLISRRGNQDAYRAKTPNAIIGIRGTRFGLLLCRRDDAEDECEKLLPDLMDATGVAIADGLYLGVTEGTIVVANEGGVRTYKAGDIGRVPAAKTAPELLRRDPGLKKALPLDLGEQPGSRPSGAATDVGTDRDAAYGVK